MFETGIERTIVVVAVGLWFAQGWYLNSRLENVHKKLDRIVSLFGSLREYLYEIDPQFDDERQAGKDFAHESSMFSGVDDLRLQQEKKREGRRTLNTPF